MTKDEAIRRFGEQCVAKARSMYETNHGKIFFIEDRCYDDEIPLDDEDQWAYLHRAKALTIDGHHETT